MKLIFKYLFITIFLVIFIFGTIGLCQTNFPLVLWLITLSVIAYFIRHKYLKN